MEDGLIKTKMTEKDVTNLGLKPLFYKYYLKHLEELNVSAEETPKKRREEAFKQAFPGKAKADNEIMKRLRIAEKKKAEQETQSGGEKN